MSARTDLTAAANTALQALHGSAYAHCVEMTFGLNIRARLDDATKPDTHVIWTGRGDLSKLEVYTSIDDGRTWQKVGRSGDPIPTKKVYGPDGTLQPDGTRVEREEGLKIGSPTTNRTVRARLIFVDGAPGTVVDSFTLRVVYSDGTTVERVETGTDLATGTLLACGYAASVGGLVALPDTSLRFLGSRGGIVNPNSSQHDADGIPINLHLSHGGTTFGQTEHQRADTDRFTRAAMAFEGWFSAEKTNGVLVGWEHLGTVGLIFQLVETTAATASKLRVYVPEYFNVLGTSRQSWLIESADDAVQLNRWHHVAVSYDGFNLTLYLDGVVVARRALRSSVQIYVNGSWSYPGIVIPTQGPVTLGRHPRPDRNRESTDTSFQGRMTEWRFYSQRLTAGAIITRMFRRASAEEITTMEADDGLECCLHMDDGVGQTAADATSNNLDFAWQQQQVGSTALEPQLAWAGDSGRLWRGIPTAYKAIGDGVLIVEARSPGRETPALSLDIDGEVQRITDAPFNVTLPDGRTFIGVGGCGRVAPIIEAGDLLPTGVQLSLSGIDPQKISIALNALYLDRPCEVLHVVWDDSGVMLDPFLLFQGKLDRMDVSLGKTGSVQVSAESNLKNWARPRNRRWNDEGHRALYPDDFGFEFLAEMVDREELWPTLLGNEGTNEEETVSEGAP